MASQRRAGSRSSSSSSSSGGAQRSLSQTYGSSQGTYAAGSAQSQSINPNSAGSQQLAAQREAQRQQQTQPLVSQITQPQSQASTAMSMQPKSNFSTFSQSFVLYPSQPKPSDAPIKQVQNQATPTSSTMAGLLLEDRGRQIVEKDRAATSPKIKEQPQGTAEAGKPLSTQSGLGWLKEKTGYNKLAEYQKKGNEIVRKYTTAPLERQFKNIGQNIKTTREGFNTGKNIAFNLIPSSIKNTFRDGYAPGFNKAAQSDFNPLKGTLQNTSMVLNKAEKVSIGREDLIRVYSNNAYNVAIPTPRTGLNISDFKEGIKTTKDTALNFIPSSVKNTFRDGYAPGFNKAAQSDFNPLKNTSMVLNKAEQLNNKWIGIKKELEPTNRAIITGETRGAVNYILDKPLYAAEWYAAGYAADKIILPAFKIGTGKTLLALEPKLSTTGTKIAYYSYKAGGKLLEGGLIAGAAVSTALETKGRYDKALNEGKTKNQAIEYATEAIGENAVKFTAFGLGASRAESSPHFNYLRRRAEDVSVQINALRNKDAFEITKRMANIRGAREGYTLPKEEYGAFDSSIYNRLNSKQISNVNQELASAGSRIRIYGSSAQSTYGNNYFEPNTISYSLNGKALKGSPRIYKDLDYAFKDSAAGVGQRIERLSGGKLQTDTHPIGEFTRNAYTRNPVEVDILRGDLTIKPARLTRSELYNLKPQTPSQVSDTLYQGKTYVIRSEETLGRKMLGASTDRIYDKPGELQGRNVADRAVKDIPDFVQGVRGTQGRIVDRLGLSPSKSFIAKENKLLTEIETYNIKDPFTQTWAGGKGGGDGAGFILPKFSKGIINDVPLKTASSYKSAASLIPSALNIKGWTASTKPSIKTFSASSFTSSASFTPSLSKSSYAPKPSANILPSSSSPLSSSVSYKIPSSIIPSPSGSGSSPRSSAPSSKPSGSYIESYAGSGYTSISTYTSPSKPSSITPSSFSYTQIDTPPLIPGVIIPPVFPGGGSGWGDDKISKALRRTKYQPSFKALALNIKLPKGTNTKNIKLTGLEVRGLNNPGTKKQKVKRR